MGKIQSKAILCDFCKKLCGIYKWRANPKGQSTKEQKPTEDLTMQKEKFSTINDIDDSIDQEYFTKEEIEYYRQKYENEQITTSSIISEMRYLCYLVSKGAPTRGRLVWDDNGSTMAVKQIPLVSLTTKLKLEVLEREIKVLGQMNHPNIVKYIGCTKDKDYFNIFLEYIPGGSISSIIEKYGKLNENIIKKYTKQILEGLEYLHAHSIIHRDIKGGNILIDTGGVCKIADFGCSKYMSDLQKKYSLKGSPYWMAPEVILQEKYERFADVWSLGCTIIEMATGKPPYSDENKPISAMLRVAHSTAPPEFPKHMSDEGKSFLSNCFQINPQKRLNVRKLLEHPFISNIKPIRYDTISDEEEKQPELTPDSIMLRIESLTKEISAVKSGK